ncbi:MAG: FGGY-family carbohydrate kinase [Anaerolineales bacterium]|nr:FGGY-family carbohydrate kinase [Anaerolineales bacterium]
MNNNTQQYVLTIDLGTSAVKVALVSVTGIVAGWEEAPLPLHLLPGGGAEQDPQDWWRSILGCSKNLLNKGLVPRQDVTAVCASTQGAGTVPVDRNGQPLMNCITWLDSRGAPYTRQVVKGAINIAGYDPIKLWRWVTIGGGAPAHSGKDIMGHMLLVKNEFPEIYERTYKFLNVLDYINLCFTGEFTATPDSIMDCWAVDNRDSNHIDYHPQMLKKLPIDPDKLPKIFSCVDVIGNIKSDVAEELGLSKDVKVVAGAMDYTSAAVGSGAVLDYQTHLYIGTSSWLAAHYPRLKCDISHYMAALPCAIPGKYLLIATQDTAGGNLTYLRDRIIFHKDAMLDVEPKDFFDTLNDVAASVPPGSNGLIYTPWLYGERCPPDDPHLRACIYNLSLQNTRSDITRAFLEGVAFNTRWMLGLVEKFLDNRPAEPINMVGGGANSDLWCQIQADVLNRTIRQVTDPVRVNVRGAAFMAGVGLGYIRYEDVPGFIQYKNSYQPNEENRAIYDERFTVFMEIYKKNKAIFQRLNKQ